MRPHLPRRRGSRDLSALRRRRRLGSRLRLLLVVVLVLVVVVGGGWLLLFSPYLTAQRVAVHGEHSITAAKVRTLARVPTGTPLARLDLAAIRARVEQLPRIRRVAVSRTWPHTVSIRVTERTPVAAVDRGERIQAVDRSGVLFGHYAKRPRRLPLIRARARVSTRALAEAARVAAALPARLRHKVNYIELKSPENINLLMHDGRLVHWGSSAQSRRKARVAAVLLKRKVDVVDVTVPERPTTTG